MAVPPWRLQIGSGDTHPVNVTDISTGGLSYEPTARIAGGTSCRLLLAGGPQVETPVGLIGPHDGPTLHLLAASLDDTKRHVLRIDSVQRDQLHALLDALEQEGVLRERPTKSDVPHSRDDTDDVRELLDAVSHVQELPPNAIDNVRSWIAANAASIQAMDKEAWPLMIRTLRLTFDRYYFGEARLRSELYRLLANIRREAGRPLHVVPMRMLKGMSRLLDRNKEVFQLLDLVWHPNLWHFLHQIDPGHGSTEPLSLVAIDPFMSEGISREKFLRLLAANPAVARRYSMVYLAAIVGHRTPLTDYTVAEQNLNKLGVRVEPRIGVLLEDDARSEEWNELLQRLNPREPARSPSMVVFSHGAPFDSVPMYWADTDECRALFRPLEYYNPSHRPVARARFFHAYPETLAALQDRLKRGGAFLLFGPEGSGKTYLAARLAEIRRRFNYIFWYQCRQFDSIENLLEHLDLFLMRLGIDEALSSQLNRGDGEADVADRLVKHLRKLDRAAILILDGLERIKVVDDGTDNRRSVPFAQFVTHLVRLLAKTDGDRISNPFLLLIHSVAAVDSERSLETLRTHLGVPRGHCLHCPIDEGDYFDDASGEDLARRLVHSSAALDRYADQFKALTDHTPYRTWLLAYWINRCMRESGPQLNATAQKRIEQIVSAVHAGYELDVFHGKLHGYLPEEDRQVLEVAAAWNLPWSRADLDGVMTGSFGYSPGAARTILDHLLEDRSPFIVPLSPGEQSMFATGDDGASHAGPFAPHLQEDPAEHERFQMPSVAAAFFYKKLAESRANLTNAHLGIAKVIGHWRGAPGEAKPDKFAAVVFDATVIAERIVCFCRAGRPSEAARLFLDREAYWRFKQLNESDRMLQLASAILDDAAQDPGFDDEMRFDMTATYANALVEGFELSKARETCARTLLTTRDPYWTCRFKLIQAKCLRYENHYREALQQMEWVAARLEFLSRRRQDRHQKDAMVWTGRTHAAMAQCYMALGELSEADRVLNEVTRPASHLEQTPRLKLEGLQCRHRGTVHLLNGDLDSAERLFKQFESAALAERDTRLIAIARYKQARVLLERVREWEARHDDTIERSSDSNHRRPAHDDVWGPGAPSNEQLLQWLEDAHRLLEMAWNGLRERDQGDRKWFPAIDLWRAYAALLMRRLLGTRASDGGRLIERIKQRLPAKKIDQRLDARGVEIETLTNSHAWQGELESAVGANPPSFLAHLVAAYSEDSERAAWNDSGPNVYKRAWRDYERMYYLGQVARRLPTGANDKGAAVQLKNSVYRAAARVYRCATSQLYHRRLTAAAYGLHRLAVACFSNRRDCLQERLEAATWLGTLSAPSREIPSVMTQIAIEALRPRPGAGSSKDIYFTVPAKVICRLVGASEAYFEIVDSGALPSTVNLVAPQCDVSLVARARMLALECYCWLRYDADWDRLVHEAPGPEIDAAANMQIARVNAGKLLEWLSRFLLSAGTASAGRGGDHSPVVERSRRGRRRKRRTRNRRSRGRTD